MKASHSDTERETAYTIKLARLRFHGLTTIIAESVAAPFPGSKLDATRPFVSVSSHPFASLASHAAPK